MCVPRDRAVGGVRPQADPLIAQAAENLVRTELGDVGIVAQIEDPLVLGSLSTASLRDFRLPRNLRERRATRASDLLRNSPVVRR
jgi:hypothetical protein